MPAQSRPLLASSRRYRLPPFATLLAAGLVLLASACASGSQRGSPTPTAPAQEAAPTGAASLADGVYTAAQASRGENRFQRSCRQCHSSGEFSGARFRLRWDGSTVDDIYGFISAAMPEANPGSLTPSQYADIVAYFLSLNGYPTGDEELTPDRAALKQLYIPSAGS